MYRFRRVLQKHLRLPTNLAEYKNFYLILKQLKIGNFTIFETFSIHYITFINYITYKTKSFYQHDNR